MADKTYRIIFQGKVADGADADAVKQKMAKLFRADAARIETLFSGKKTVLKTADALDEAERFKAMIEKTGAVCEIMTAGKGASTPPPAPEAAPEKKAAAKKQAGKPSGGPPPLPPKQKEEFPDVPDITPGQPSGVTAGEDAPAPPSKIWYYAAGVVFLAGIIGAAWLVFSAIITSLAGGSQFKVPGTLNIAVDKPGTYVLWHETQTIFQGQPYSTVDVWPEDMEVHVWNDATQIEVPLETSSGVTETVGSVKRHAVGNMEFPSAGTYTIEVKGDFPDKIFYVRRSMWKKIVVNVVIASVIGIIALLGAPLLAVVVFVKRSNALRGPVRAEGGTGPPGGPVQAMDDDKAQMWGMFCHLGMLVGFIIVPLIIWLLKREESEFVADHGKEALNFQITLAGMYLISFILMFVVIGFVLMIGVAVYSVVMVIIATIKTSRGETYRYPLTVRLIK